MDGARALLAEADARRDAGDWAAAAEAYGKYLARVPEAWPIWVQHGHCVKEAGDPAGALASYRRAEAGMPGDADLQLQIGHALKLAGDPAGARAAYARSLELDPSGDAAWHEAERLLGIAMPAGAGVVLDLSDLLAWFRVARTPSGIQRVQLGLAAAATASGSVFAGTRLVVFRPAGATWRELPVEMFRRLAGLSRSGADPQEPRWTEAVAAAEALLEAAPDFAFPRDAWLMNPGSSWWLPGYHGAVRVARARHRLRYAALVHDAGPVVAPEHGEPAHSASFARWISVLGIEADLLLAVSDATRRDVTRIAADALAPLPFAPVEVLRPDAATPPAPVGAPHPRAAEIAAEPYALFVATIESRKDHLFVLNAWLGLLRRHGAALPRLLLVGRAGFDAAPVLDLLRRVPADRVTWLDDVSDPALASLYAGALFTVYHSSHEGWGLPVTEALAAGKAVVAPRHSGLVEAGQDLALLVTPGSEPEFAAAVERLSFDASFRRAAEARIAAGLRLRSWSAVAKDLHGLLAAAPPRPRILPAPALGVVHRLGAIESPHPQPAMAWAEMLRDGAGWQAPESWGCWTRPGRAVLRLPLPGRAAAPLRLHLALRGAETAREVTFRLGGAAPVAVHVPPGTRPVVALDVPAAAEIAEVVIGADAEPGEEVGIGVVAVMACTPDDVLARLGFLERLSFVWPEVV